jgi:CRP-like cAMP-binding protein
MHRGRATADGTPKRLPASHNRILASLPPADYDALLPELESVYVPTGVHLDEFSAPFEHVYFPTQGVVSLLYSNESGESAELALVGAEGMVSATSFMVGQATTHRALAWMPCFAYRLPARRLKAKFLEGGALQRLLLAYTQGLVLQISMTALCNRHHTLEKQLSRWLLQSLDRTRGDDLRVTQELIASLLGVRRQGVTEAVCRLEERGLVTWARGRITVTDRAGLEANACECYRLLRRDMQRLAETGLSSKGIRVAAIPAG